MTVTTASPAAQQTSDDILKNATIESGKGHLYQYNAKTFSGRWPYYAYLLIAALFIISGVGFMIGCGILGFVYFYFRTAKKNWQKRVDHYNSILVARAGASHHQHAHA